MVYTTFKILLPLKILCKVGMQFQYTYCTISAVFFYYVAYSFGSVTKYLARSSKLSRSTALLILLIHYILLSHILPVFHLYCGRIGYMLCNKWKNLYNVAIIHHHLSDLFVLPVNQVCDKIVIE